MMEIRRCFFLLLFGFSMNIGFSQEHFIDSTNSAVNGDAMLWSPDDAPEPHDSLNDVPDSLPRFPGGQEAMMKFISDNLVYPALAREMGVSGKVYIQFVVEKDGSISNVEVMKGFDELCEREAVRVIKSMPNWTPAIGDDVPVRSRFRIPIVFNLT